MSYTKPERIRSSIKVGSLTVCISESPAFGRPSKFSLQFVRTYTVPGPTPGVMIEKEVPWIFAEQLDALEQGLPAIRQALEERASAAEARVTVEAAKLAKKKGGRPWPGQEGSISQRKVDEKKLRELAKAPAPQVLSNKASLKAKAEQAKVMQALTGIGTPQL